MHVGGLFFTGTSNIVVPHKQADYPPEYRGASRLTYYASLCSSIEINATFYKLPRIDTVRKWTEMVPPGFRFTFKIPKTITHVKGLQYDSKDIVAFAQVIAPAAAHKGCLLLQLPPSVKRDKEEELNALLENISEETSGWKLAVELRDNSWYRNPVYRMLQHYGATMVQQDLQACATPQIDVAPDFTYLRFHGPEPGYRGCYDNTVLEAFAIRIAALVKEGRDVYAYFNNTLGDALNNVQQLKAMVHRVSSGNLS
jgi:uncharacterized protein YecE (DUF72 family)